jgi:hypothetical protein
LCRSDWQLWRKHSGRFGRAAYLLILVLHHSARVAVSAIKYLFLPSQRPSSLFKLKRSLAILKWLCKAKDRDLIEGPRPSAKPESPAA